MSGFPTVSSGRRRLRAVLALVVSLGLAAAAGASPRLVAVGDVHGDLEAFKAILVEAGVLDARGEWAGGDAMLVQVGDLIDRGPSMRGTLDFAMALGPKAEKKGGKVVFLLGNHEVMNMAGDLRYVAAANYAEFADAESARRLDEAWKQVVALRGRRARELGRPAPATGAEARAAWLAKHPPGFLEHQEAFGPTGIYGRWLRQRPACILIEGNAFLHGGLSPAYADSLEALDRRVHEDLDRLDADRQRFVVEGLILPFFDLGETMEAVRETLAALDAKKDADAASVTERREVYEHFLDWGSWTINAEDGPLWFRGFGRWSDAEGDARMPRLLAAAHARRFVVGHTVDHDGRVSVRFGGTAFLIDTGMLDGAFFPGGRASALEILDGSVGVFYPGEARRELWPEAPKKAAALRP